MITDEQVRAALRGFIKRNTNGGNILAKVQSVSESDNTCTLVDDEDSSLTYPDVQLRPVVDGNEAVTIYPKPGTWAIAVPVEETGRLMVLSVGECDKVRVKTGGSVLEVSGTGIKVQAPGSVVELSSSGIKIEKGESLRAILNDLITAIQAITVTASSFGSPTTIPNNSAAFGAINARLNNVLI